jgi:hypothetical protein
MNEQELAKEIVQRLDQSLRHLNDDTIAKLRSAREAALERYQNVPERVFDFVTAGDFRVQRAPVSARKLLAVALMVLGLIGISYWQMASVDDDLAELDASLLSGDLPINAYLDSDFEAWLNRSSPSQ